MPGLYIITGSNGAGKSTVGYTYFPEQITSIFDGDKLYPETKSRLWKAGPKVQKELNALASDFVEKAVPTSLMKAIFPKTKAGTLLILLKRTGIKYTWYSLVAIVQSNLQTVF